MRKFLFLILVTFLLLFLGTIAFIGQIVRKAIRKESLEDYFYSLIIGLDQLGGTILYGLEDWCISSIAYYDSQKGKNIYLEKFINFLFKDKEHCKNSYFTELKERGFNPPKR